MQMQLSRRTTVRRAWRAALTTIGACAALGCSGEVAPRIVAALVTRNEILDVIAPRRYLAPTSACTIGMTVRTLA